MISWNKITSRRSDPGQACDFDGLLSVENYYISGSLLLPHFEYVFSFYPSRDQKRSFHFFLSLSFFFFSFFVPSDFHRTRSSFLRAHVCSVDFNGNTHRRKRVEFYYITKRDKKILFEQALSFLVKGKRKLRVNLIRGRSTNQRFTTPPFPTSNWIEFN